MRLVPRGRGSADPNLRDRLYELLEHDPLAYSIGSRFIQVIISVIVLDVVAMILASVPELDARFDTLFSAVAVLAVIVFALEYAARLWTVAGHTQRNGSALSDRLGLCLLRARHHRPHGVPAGRDRAGHRPARDAGWARRAAVLQADPLFAGDALAARGHPCRAACADRLHRHPDRRGTDLRLAALRHRA